MDSSYESTREICRFMVRLLPLMYFILAIGTEPAEDAMDFVVKLCHAGAVAGLVCLTLQCVRFVIREELERRDAK